MTTTETALALTIPDEAWDPIGPDMGELDEDVPAEKADRLFWSRILYRPGVTINGVGFHLEGWAVEYDEDAHMQVADWQDEALGQIHNAVGADGSWDTVTINDREYVLVMSPYS
jgi:hypothetical protein